MANEFYGFSGRPTPIPTGRPPKLREAIRQLLGERAVTDEVATKLAATADQGLHGKRARPLGRPRNAAASQGRLIA